MCARAETTGDKPVLLDAERLVLLFGVFALCLYTDLEIPLRRPLELYLERAREAGLLYLVALACALLLRRLADLRSGMSARRQSTWADTWARFYFDYLRPRRMLLDVRLFHALALVFVVFIQLKHLIPFVNPALHDQTIAAAERFLFADKLAGEHLIAFLGPSAAALLSHGYILFYPYLAVLCVLGILNRERGFGERFAYAFALTWFLGILVVYAVPTFGPCFFEPQIVASLPATDVTAMQQDLWKNRLYVEANPFSAAGVFLISGLPSLHLAIPILGMIFFARSNRIFAAASALLAAVTTLSTLYFGWHYVIDDLLAVALASGANTLSKSAIPPEKRLP